MAELKPCKDAAEADFLAGKFNLNLMRNNGDQGVYVIAKDGMPMDEQRQQIIDQIREKREMASAGSSSRHFWTGHRHRGPENPGADADFLGRGCRTGMRCSLRWRAGFDGGCEGELLDWLGVGLVYVDSGNVHSAGGKDLPGHQPGGAPAVGAGGEGVAQ